MVERPGRLTYDDAAEWLARPPWNHNVHYHPLILDRVPPGCRWALDVGCGEGILARELAVVVPHVVGLDVHAPSLATARATPSRVTWVRGDLARHPFRPETFDLVTAVASLHHLDGESALRSMRELLCPGGRLVVVALARSRWPRDLPWEVAAVVAHRAHLLTRRLDEQRAPTMWPPPYTYDGLRRLAEDVLPGVRFRRHLLWRASLDWTKPLSGS